MQYSPETIKAAFHRRPLTKIFVLKLKKPLVRVKIRLLINFKHTGGGIQVLRGQVDILPNRTKIQGSKFRRIL